jgi:hypothetical protein
MRLTGDGGIRRLLQMYGFAIQDAA